MKRRLSGVVLAAWLMCSHAWAQGADDVTRNAARSLGVSGVEAYESGDYAAASSKLDKAYQVLEAPSLGLWSARALVKLNRLVEAAERYQEVQRLDYSGGDMDVQKRAKQEAAAEQQALAARIPSVVVRLENASVGEVKVTIDGVPVVSALLGEKRPVNPGKHRVLASRGEQTLTEDVELVAGESKPILFRFTAQSSVPAGASSAAALGQPRTDTGTSGASTRRTVGFVALAVGGAGLVVGGIAGGLAWSKKGTIDGLEADRCRNDVCLYSEQELVDSYSQWRTISSVGFIAGSVLAATGIVLLVTSPRQQTVALRIGPGSVALQRTF